MEDNNIIKKILLLSTSTISEEKKFADTKGVPDFLKFIKSLLKRCKLKDQTIDAILSYKGRENMSGLECFRYAFTHKSYDGIEGLNYELYELLGDTILNEIVVEYISRRFPRVVSVKWLTRIKHNLISKKVCGTLAEGLGFFKYILYGNEKEDELQVKDCSNKIYMSMLEDTLEAFLGCLVDISNSMHKYKIGYHFAYNFISDILDEIRIPITYDEVFDAKSRLKEIYDKRGWKIKNEIQVSSKINNDAPIGMRTSHTVKVYGYPLGDKTSTYQNRVLLSCQEAKSIGIAEQLACEESIAKLRKYNIVDIPPNPYERNLDSKKARKEKLRQKIEQSQPKINDDYLFDE